MLRRVPIFEELAEDAANHHERLDGRGYFRGLTGDQLTPTARVLAVADVADALMSARPYREAMPIDQVLALIQQGRATEFCPDCVDVLGVALAARRRSSLSPTPAPVHGPQISPIHTDT